MYIGKGQRKPFQKIKRSKQEMKTYNEINNTNAQPNDMIEFVPAPSRIIHAEPMKFVANTWDIQVIGGVESIPAHAKWGIAGFGLPDGMMNDQACFAGVPTRVGEYDVVMVARYDGEAAEVRVHITVE